MRMEMILLLKMKLLMTKSLFKPVSKPFIFYESNLEKFEVGFNNFLKDFILLF